MIEFIQILVDNDLAYEMDGNIFFSIEKYPHYGKQEKKKMVKFFGKVNGEREGQVGTLSVL